MFIGSSIRYDYDRTCTKVETYIFYWKKKYIRFHTLG